MVKPLSGLSPEVTVTGSVLAADEALHIQDFLSDVSASSCTYSKVPPSH